MRHPHMLRAAFVLIAFAAPPSIVTAAIPNPSYSTCIFPTTIPDAPQPVTVDVTVQKGEARPIPGAFVQVNILVESGTLSPGQAMTSSILTDANGHAAVAFNAGILGNGQIRLQVHADGVLLCTSVAYQLAGPVPTQPVTWGHLKTIYGNRPNSPWTE